MKNLGYICILCCLPVLYYGCSNTKSGDKTGADLEQVALTDSILSYFRLEQFDKVVIHFDDVLKRQLNKEQLAVMWAQLNTQVGKFTKSEFFGAEKIVDVGDKIVYTCYFSSQKLYFQLVFGKENQVVGLFFTPQPN